MLHDYQQRGVKWIIDNLKCALFQQMGAGKTLTTLTAIDELKNDYFSVNKVLIIGPKRVIESTWPDEIAKWHFDLTYSVVSGSRKQREDALKQKADIYLISKENVVWLTEYLKDSWDFDMVVVDELSAFKNPQAKRFKALKKMPYQRFVGLTGTPTPKGIPDLWAQLYLMDSGQRLKKTLTGFRQTFLLPDRQNGHIVYSWKLKEGAEEAIKEKISDICMSISPKEYATLPDLSLIESEIEMPGEISFQYRSFKRDLVLSMPEGKVTAANAGVLSNKLIQFTSGQIYFESGIPVDVHQLKTERLMRLLDESGDEPVIIFYYFKHEKERIEKVLLKENISYSTLDNPSEVARWNAGEYKVLLIQPQSAGHGLNLQAGGHIAIWYTMPNWNLELYQQANARLYRQGQKNKVSIYHLILKGTIDEDMLSALKSKEDVQKRLLEALEK